MKNKMIFVLMLPALVLANCTARQSVVPSATKSAAPIPRVISSATAIWMPSPSIEPTYTPTVAWTPLPTLSEQDVNEKIKELLDTNGGCELPCWWGITPNKTSWAETLHFLSPFIFQLEQGAIDVYDENGKEHTYTNFQFLYNIPGEAQPAQIELGVLDDIVIGMVVYSPGGEYQYQLHQLLTLLGPPNQILINAQSSSPIPELPPTVLTLDYSDLGIWALYGYIPTQVGKDLVICPESSLGKVSIFDSLGGRFRLFDPKMENDRALSIEEYAEMVGGFTAMNLEDVTNMSVETFYNAFVDPASENCLETPANYWP